MWKHQLRTTLPILALTGCGIYLADIGWEGVQTAHKLKHTSTVTQGRVISSNSRAISSKGGQTSVLLVEYKPANHPAITKEFDVSGDDYRKAQDTNTTVVTYLPEDPHVSRVTDFDIMPYKILVGFGGIITLAGLFCFWHMNMRKKVS